MQKPLKVHINWPRILDSYCPNFTHFFSKNFIYIYNRQVPYRKQKEIFLKKKKSKSGGYILSNSERFMHMSWLYISIEGPVMATGKMVRSAHLGPSELSNSSYTLYFIWCTNTLSQLILWSCKLSYMII